MITEEYVITVHNHQDWQTIHDGLVKGQLLGRVVECVNDRPMNDYSSHYLLTDLEAATLADNPFIQAVELPPENNPFIRPVHFGVRSAANYDRTSVWHYQTSVLDASMKNWGLLRSTVPSNPFASSNSVTAEFAYDLDGTGVDIVMIDTGIEPNHPEFAVNADGTGGSRVVDYDWSQHNAVLSGLGDPVVVACATGQGINGYLGDCEGHGTNTASIAAGNTCGWASGARLYSIRAFGPGDDITTGKYLSPIVSTSYVFDLVKAFHLAKIANGNLRPTICSNSWGYTSYLGSVAEFNSATSMTVNYRGVNYPYTGYSTEMGPRFGVLIIEDGLSPLYNGLNGARVPSVEAAAQSCANAGVLLVGAAGNSSYKIDVPGGADYNNSYTLNYNPPFYAPNGIGYYSYVNYYHRGTITSANCFVTVGALDSVGADQKADYSCAGPRVDVFAPGTDIMAASADVPLNGAQAVQDPRSTNVTIPNSPYGHIFYLSKDTGTSQATPQVTGVLACVMQARPTMTATEARSFLSATAVKNAMPDSGSAVDYTNVSGSLLGAPNRVLQMPFTSPATLNIVDK